MRVLMHAIACRAPPCSLRELPPSGEKAHFDTEMASRGSEYSEPLSYVILTLKTLTQAMREKKAPYAARSGLFRKGTVSRA